MNAYTLKKICEVLDIRPSDLENEVYEPHTHYHTDNATSEIKRLKEEIAILKDLVSMQKEVIMELKEKRQPKKKIKGA